jgi:hypothetical protein
MTSFLKGFSACQFPSDKTENRFSGLVQKRPENPGFSAFGLSGHKKWPENPAHTAGFDGIFGPKSAKSRLRYPEEPPYVPTLLPTEGPMDYRLDGLF